MKRILVSYDPSNRIDPIVILGDKLVIESGNVRVLVGDSNTVVAHLQNYAWVAFEENRPATRVLDIRGAN